ncbi:MAG TPA: polysaccharide biosynthesis tyrosine autokinase, partial [Terriglobia bacterium]|nr:polysaccharide biosynthesis tyrosine autokinase [Terriglobia bacterium]
QENGHSPGKAEVSKTDAPLNTEEIRAVKTRLSVEPDRRSRIVRIVYTSPNPQTSADFVNTLARLYIDDNTDDRSSSIYETRALLEKQERELKSKLQQKEEELKAFSAQAGILPGNGENSVAENKLRLLQVELSRAEAERITQEAVARDAREDAPDAMIQNDVIRQYQVTLTNLRNELADMETILTPENYKVERLKAQIAQMEAAIKKEREKERQRRQSEYEASLRKEQALRDTVANQSSTALDYSAKVLHYNVLRNEMLTAQNFYNAIAEKLNDAKVATSVRPAEVRLLSKAHPPGRPYSPRMPWYAGSGAAAGLLLAVGYVTVKERGVRRLRAPGDAVICGLPELGAIPSAPPRPIGGKVVKRLTGRSWSTIEKISFEQEGSDMSESFRGALVSILSAARTGHSARSILITSALPMEGKTTVASNVAITLSRFQKRVVLIDADLRRPRLHEIFKIDNSHGLATLLADSTPVEEIDLEELLQPTPLPNLFVIASGSNRAGFSHLLYSNRLGELVQRLLQEFDHVLIDAPPCLKFADARGLARHVDGVLLVLRANYTYDKLAEAAAQTFLADGVPVLGTILNRWNPRSRSAYGFSAYGSGL